MTEMLWAVVAALILLLPATAVAAPSEVQLVAPFVEGQLLVGFDPGLSPAEVAEIHEANGASLVRRFSEINVDLVRISSGVSTRQSVSQYRFASSVRFAEPDYLRSFDANVPNDTRFSEQWAPANSGQTVNGDPGTADADMDATEAWDVTTGSASPIVAIIDSGIQVTHPDLNDNLWINPNELAGNGVDDDGNGYVDDVNGWDFLYRNGSVFDSGNTCSGNQEDFHGTHVAGIIGAEGNNSAGVSGVNWDVRLMSLKFIGRSPNGTSCVGADSHAIEAMLYAARNGADVANLSWGGSQPDEALRQAMIAASDAGILWAVAAGNTGADLTLSPQYPGGFDLESEIVVASSTNDDTLSSFSSFGGPTDLAAPGSAILSTFPSGAYAFLQGTSMAAPQVAGALALLRAQYPHAPPSELKERVLTTVDIKPAFAPGITQTGGRLNLDKALRQVLPITPTMISPNGGERFTPGSTQTISWDPNVPSGNPAVGHRLEYTTNTYASTTETTTFETGLPATFQTPADGDAPWMSTTPSRPGSGGTLSIRAGAIADSQASWVTTSRKLSRPGSISFWYQVNSEICAGTDCGDFFRFFVDGVRLVSRAGNSGWTQVTFPIAQGVHTFSWAYQKDPNQVAGSDTVWIDDVVITGIDNVAWLPLTTTSAGASSFAWLIPNTPTGSARVRVCENSGPNCDPATSDESDDVFAITSCPPFADFFAYDPGFTGGIYVTTGDLDADGCDEIIAGAGPGGGPHVKAFRGNGAVLAGTFPYDVNFKGGVRVAAADVDGDGADELITGPGKGGGPHIKVFDLAGNSLVEQSSFFAFDPGFTGGVFPAGGNFLPSSDDEIAIGAGEGGGPHVKVMDEAGATLSQFFPFALGFTGGVRVAASNIQTSDSQDELVTAAGPGGGPHVKAWDVLGASFGERLSFFPYDPSFTGGVYPGGGQLIPGGEEEIVTGAGEGGGPHVRIFGSAAALVGNFFAYDVGFRGGVRVAGSLADNDLDGEVVSGAGPAGGPHIRVFE